LPQTVHNSDYQQLPAARNEECSIAINDRETEAKAPTWLLINNWGVGADVNADQFGWWYLGVLNNTVAVNITMT